MAGKVLTTKQKGDRAVVRSKKVPKSSDRVSFTDYAGKKHLGVITNIEDKTAWVRFGDKPISEAMALSTLRKEEK